MFKKGERDPKDNYQSAYSRYLKSLRDAFFAYYPALWISFCQNTNQCDICKGYSMQYQILLQ